MSGQSADPVKILRSAVEMEIQGAEFYETAAGRMRNQRGKEMFRSLIKQETLHKEILEAQLGRFARDGEWLPLEQLKAKGSRTKVGVFQSAEVRKLVVAPGAGELEVVKLGMEIERKSVEYYRAAGSGIEDKDARDLFNWLVAQEAGHLTILQAEYDYRTRSGFYMGDPEFSLEVM